MTGDFVLLTQQVLAATIGSLSEIRLFGSRTLGLEASSLRTRSRMMDSTQYFKSFSFTPLITACISGCITLWSDCLNKIRLIITVYGVESSYRTVPLSPLNMKWKQVFFVKFIIIPAGVHPHILVVSIFPAGMCSIFVNTWGMQNHAWKMGGNCYPVEIVNQVPANDRVEVWTLGIGQASISFFF